MSFFIVFLGYTNITKTKEMFFLLGLYNVSVKPALDLQVLCELSWSIVLLLPVSMDTFGIWHPQKKKRRDAKRNIKLESIFTSETANSYLDHQWWGFQRCFLKYRVICWVWQKEAEHAHDFTYQQQGQLIIPFSALKFFKFPTPVVESEVSCRFQQIEPCVGRYLKPKETSALAFGIGGL